MVKANILVMNDINLKFDTESHEYYIVWEPIAIGTGKTRHEALEDLRMAAHFSVDPLINMKLKNTDTKKEE